MNLKDAYAIPLFALVDPAKIDVDVGLPDSFADQLQAYFEAVLKIRALSFQFITARGEPYLVISGLEQDSLPALFSLADVQKTTLFKYDKPDMQTVVLTPLAVKVD